MPQGEYGEKNIKILSDLDHIRLRMGMYIGENTDPRHLFSEAFDNAVDELQTGNGTKITVKVDTKLNAYTISDDGRGIPHGKKKLGEDDVEILKLLCTKSNTGAKFDSDSYLMSAGLHGVGLAVINALSKHLTMTSVREGNKVNYEAHTDTLTYEKHDKTKHGSCIYFIPDKQYFQSSVIPVDYLIERCRTANAFGVATELIIDGTAQAVEARLSDLIKTEEGIKEYGSYPVIYTSKNNNEERVVLFLQYTSDTKDKYYGYTNMLYNSQGGTHVNLISTKVISGAWEEYIKKTGTKLGVELRKGDYLTGLRCVVAVFISNPSFAGQTKEKLSVDKAKFDTLMPICQKEIVKAIRANEELSGALLKRFEEYRISQNKLLSRKEISSFIKQNNDSPDNVRRKFICDKLVDCTSKSRDDTELYICEGASAAGPACRMRDAAKQAVLQLRGKILNVTGVSVQDAIKSEEVCNITNSIGCGIGSQCDSSKSRYERVLVNADGDEDGAHIVCLVISVFVNLLPDIVKDGRLFVVIPPLYGWSEKSGNKFTNDRDQVPANCKLKRYKGLGSMADKDFFGACMDKKGRTLVQVDYPSDLDAFNKILGTSSGKADILKDLGLVRYE